MKAPVDIDGVFILAQQKTPAPPQREQQIEDFEAEIAHFERLKPQLLQQYPERYVAIYQGEVVAVGDQKMDVWAAAAEALGNVPFYVGQVTEKGLRRVRTPSAGCQMNIYNADFEPPALCVNVTIANTINHRKRSILNALLDKGSDITAIPSEQARLLDLYTRTQIRLETIEGTSSVIYTYGVHFTLGEIEPTLLAT